MKVQIRAIPAPGHTVRLRAGRPWTQEPRIVEVVDKPRDPIASKDAEGRITRTWFDEISHPDLVALKGDRYIAVTALDGEGGDPTEIADLKAKLLELETALAKARLAHQSDVEDMKRELAGARNDAEMSAITVSRLTDELAQAQAQFTAPVSKRAKG